MHIVYFSYSSGPLNGWLADVRLDNMELLNLVQLFLFLPVHCILLCSSEVILHCMLTVLSSLAIVIIIMLRNCVLYSINALLLR